MIFTAEANRPAYNLRGKRIWVAGHSGMVGSALVRRLQQEDCAILTVSHRELDLTRQSETENWMRRNCPDAIFVAAALAGGIKANAQYPVDFLYINTMIAMNVIKTAADIKVEKLLWLGSSCIYPKFASQPITEDSLLTGSLEPTNEPYAIAKIAGLKLAEACAKQYGMKAISAMPTNLYGPNDNFDLESSHVLPALIRKIHDAKAGGASTVEVWGTGAPQREFLHVDDLADACVHLMVRYAGPRIVNIGSGREISIGDLAVLVADVLGYEGRIVFNSAMPDGTPRKLLDSSCIRSMGWQPKIELEAGIGAVYAAWRQQLDNISQVA
ncbi:GDP-L-fucose synthase [Rhizobium sp. R693]|uniref:GDP-L-fucose synthase family protein n=1 Tax=Rhizobium sp. R693 TaxID=1764276 RepID=UPI000B52CD06|nr:GDP-L-fucose synthase [Rhizobium sp. R693]OWV84510.1 GDP-fucose synthetase [Rhizobium sp. R693]